MSSSLAPLIFVHGARRGVATLRRQGLQAVRKHRAPVLQTQLTPPKPKHESRRDILVILERRGFASQGAAGSRGENPEDKREGKKLGDKTKKDGDESAAREDAGDSAPAAGPAMTMLGASGFAASIFLQSPVAKGALRVLGPGGMLIGALMTIYELGGWRLIFSIPLLIGGGSALCNVIDGSAEQTFKEAVLREVQEGFPELPAGVEEALKTATAKEYETNRLCLQAECDVEEGGKASRSRLYVLAKRESRFQPWVATTITASRGVPKEIPAGGVGQPPPQTRYWSAEGGQMEWKVVWQRQ